MDDGGSGTTYGVDGTLRFLRNYRFEWQALGSHTEEPVSARMSDDINGQLVYPTFDHGKHTAAFDGESFSGAAFYGGFRRDGKVWNAEALYHQYSPDFRADNGFVTQNNIRQANIWTGLDFRPKKNFFTLVTPNVSLGRVWNFDNIRKDEWVRPELYAQFKGQSEAWISYLWSREQFHGKVFPGIKRFATYGSTRFSNPVAISYQVQIGRFIARNIADPVLGKGATAEVWGTFKPVQRLAIEPDINYSVLHHPDDDSRIFEGTIFRVRGQYQFTRELFLRLITQYDEFDGSLEIDPLVSYKLNPFTVAYLGSTHDYNDGAPDEGFMPTQRQFFAKLQYLFKT
jgi:hypothetical protein